MQIVCPKCQTSYGVTPNALGPNGRNVRCAKCKEVWLAAPEGAVVAQGFGPPDIDDTDEAGGPRGDRGGVAPAHDDVREHEAPMIESPPLAHDALADTDGELAAQIRQTDTDRADDEEIEEQRPSLRRGRVGGMSRAKPRLHLTAGAAAMAAVIIGLVMWRTDVVRLMPQTDAFFRLAGLKVNVRNLRFDDVSVSTMTEGGAPFIVIKGTIVPTGARPVEVPRLRFVLNDEHGTAIYAWNALPERAVLAPGEATMFKSRVASPPPNASELVVRFFNRRDLLSGGA
jgi:predicted Zn finger-like uncharacterized protein